MTCRKVTGCWALGNTASSARSWGQKQPEVSTPTLPSGRGASWLNQIRTISCLKEGKKRERERIRAEKKEQGIRRLGSGLASAISRLGDSRAKDCRRESPRGPFSSAAQRCSCFQSSQSLVPGSDSVSDWRGSQGSGNLVGMHVKTVSLALF